MTGTEAVAALGRVEALHQPGATACGFTDCDDCGPSDDCAACYEVWPCPTIVAIRGEAT